jgi:hypothetical protein
MILALLSVLAARFVVRDAGPSPLPGVPEFALVPTTIAIPSGRSPAARRISPSDTRYVIRNEGDGNHLFLVDGDSYDRVIGTTPTLVAGADSDFRGFTDVLSPSGTTTYAIYIKHDGPKPIASDLYALTDNRSERILSNVDPAGIGSLDSRIPLGGAYLDWKGNLYVMTLGGTLCVIRDGRVVGQADVTKIGGHRPAIPSMFSNPAGTYFLVPKMLDQDNSMGGLGPKTESETRAKYKISLDG